LKTGRRPTRHGIIPGNGEKEEEKDTTSEEIATPDQLVAGDLRIDRRRHDPDDDLEYDPVTRLEGIHEKITNLIESMLLAPRVRYSGDSHSTPKHIGGIQT
jgi:hypothetical protein